MINMTPLAILSDVHGNRLALEAVLADIDQRSIAQILNLGDSLYGPLDPAGTADIIMARSIPSIRGNEDRILLTPHNNCENSPSLEYTRRCLRSRHFRWLKSLPPTAVFNDVCFAFHGSPDNDQEYFLQEVTAGGLIAVDKDRLHDRLADITQEIILCGHDHTPAVVQLPDGRLIVNPGSVGLPAFTDETPYPHIIETGSPHARYAIVSGNSGNWNAEIITLAYDWEFASKMAERQGRSDWSRWLKSGRAKSAN